MSDNPQFDSILSAEYGDEQGFMDSAIKSQIGEIVSNFDDKVVDFKLHDDTVLSISEQQGYELASKMAVEFNWSAYITTVHEVCDRIETLLKKEMPDAVKTAMSHICEASDFWLDAKGLLPHGNILLAFFLAENGVMDMDSLQQVVQLELNNMLEVLSSSESYRQTTEIAAETMSETVAECQRLVEKYGDEMPQDVVDFIQSMIESEED